MSENASSAPPAPKGGSPAVPRRTRATRRSVLIADAAANWIITIGGLGVILAVFGIMVFLAKVVTPLFTGSHVVAQQQVKLEDAAGEVLSEIVDEYRTIVVSVQRNGEVAVHHLPTGRLVQKLKLDTSGKSITAFSRTLDGDDMAVGFNDGTLRLGRIHIDSTVLKATDVAGDLAPLGANALTDGTGVLTPIGGGQVRRIAVKLALDEPQSVAPESVALVKVDYRLGGAVERPTRSFVSIDANGTLRLSRLETKRSLLGGAQGQATLNSYELPRLPEGSTAASLLMTSLADQVYAVDQHGTMFRYDTRDPQKPVLAEQRRITPNGVGVTTLGFLVGEQSIIVGGADGSVNVYFRLPQSGSKTVDGFDLVKTHTLEPHTAGVVAFAASPRSKSFVTADAAGNVWVRHATSEQTLLKLKGDASITSVALAPREDGVVAVGRDERLWDWQIDMPHPETTLSSIFGKVWYEGYPQPEFTWQSSSGTDSFEPKFSLVPLIFGTVKAAFYSLLFAIPIALCAAIYTSEFVGPRVRNIVKPVMEMMASLPSVVLGFIAALILAPIVESWIAAIVLAFVVMPLSVFLGAYLWQFLPQTIALRVGGAGKMIVIGAVLCFSVWTSLQLAPIFEALFFDGDFRAWANGDIGSSWPFLMLLAWPLCFLLVLALDARGFVPFLPGGNASARQDSPLVGLVRWLMAVGFALALAWLLATALLAVGIDARGTVVGTYVQRNTFVVGFAMGFAVIPIMYTIAEDALAAVPEHLRGASLACGATPWQTAILIIVPTAMSGIFAAMMVGLGRAVGETMIVVMAAGNTPIIDGNIFSGLRALSANIAVELPEAVKDGTLYRMLFLAALTLFVMTFALNTLAELVRQKFRKRAAQL